MPLDTLLMEKVRLAIAGTEHDYAHLCSLMLVQRLAFELGANQVLLLIRELLQVCRSEGVCEKFAHANGTLIESFVLALRNLPLPFNQLLEHISGIDNHHVAVIVILPPILFKFCHGEDVHFEFEWQHNLPACQTAKLTRCELCHHLTPINHCVVRLITVSFVERIYPIFEMLVNDHVICLNHFSFNFY